MPVVFHYDGPERNETTHSKLKEIDVDEVPAQKVREFCNESS